ncbi:hypothetical protein THAOC_04594, partial [Thalassiosira oceanica]
ISTAAVARQSAIASVIGAEGLDALSSFDSRVATADSVHIVSKNTPGYRRPDDESPHHPDPKSRFPQSLNKRSTRAFVEIEGNEPGYVKGPTPWTTIVALVRSRCLLCVTKGSTCVYDSPVASPGESSFGLLILSLVASESRAGSAAGVRWCRIVQAIDNREPTYQFRERARR